MPKLERFDLDGVKGINHLNILKGFINQYDCHAAVPEFLSVTAQCLMDFFFVFYYKAWFADNGLCNAFFTHEFIFKLILFSYNPIFFIWYRTLKVIIGPIDMCVGSNVADALRWLWLSMDSWDFILKKQNQVTGTPVTSLMADKC